MNILLIVDSFAKNSSGGRVARYLVELLQKLNLNVFILSPSYFDEKNVFWIDDNLTKSIKKQEYKRLLLENKIDIVHFATYGNGKPSFYHTIAKELNLKIVAQIWMHDFYCQKLYNFTNKVKCSKCSNNLLNAFSNECITYNIDGLKKFIKKVIFKKNFLQADAYISPSLNIIDLMTQYGVDSKKIYHIPLLFDFKRFPIYNYQKPQNYIIFYGSAIEVKGIDFIKEFAKKYQDINIKIIPSNNVSNFDFSTNVEILNDISWDNGLEALIKNAKAVLIPSIWDSSTEYALVESLSLGVPPIVFAVGVHKEIIKNNENGFIFEIDDYEGVANAILYLDDEYNHKNISRNARKTYEVLTSETNYLKLLKKLYEEIV